MVGVGSVRLHVSVPLIEQGSVLLIPHYALYIAWVSCVQNEDATLPHSVESSAGLRDLKICPIVAARCGSAEKPGTFSRTKD
jgi:hypothetical protein